MNTDVVVIGGGFGGSLTAMVLSRLGHRVTLLESNKHPRFAIGESTTPLANAVLRRLCDRYNLSGLRPIVRYGSARSALPDIVVGRKRGFSYFRHMARSAFAADADHSNELLITANTDDWDCDTHWLRSDVDAFFVAQAREAGVSCFESAAVLRIGRADPQTDWDIAAETPSGRVQLRTPFVVDASGTSSTLAKRLALTDITGTLSTHSMATYSHFLNVRPFGDIIRELGGSTSDHPFDCETAALHHVLDEGWLWILRFCDGRVSAGLMSELATTTAAHRNHLRTGSLESWRQLLAPYPSIAAQFENARLAPVPGNIVVTRRLQRLVSAAAGPGWAFLPATAGFVDPLHSTGIAHTIWAIARLAAWFEGTGEVASPAAADAYSTALVQEIQFIDELVSLAYACRGRFELWIGATMLYEAAATTLEHDLATNPSVPQTGFLQADVPAFRDAIRTSTKALMSAAAADRDAASAEALSLVENEMEAFNVVDLFRPPVPNMYAYTASPV